MLLTFLKNDWIRPLLISTVMKNNVEVHLNSFVLNCILDFLFARWKKKTEHPPENGDSKIIKDCQNITNQIFWGAPSSGLKKQDLTNFPIS